jgi:hypothetical protein
MPKRPYSMAFTARSGARRYLLSGIPPTLWERVRAKARREHIAVRALILGLLEAWLAQPDAPAKGGPDNGAAPRVASKRDRPPP